MYFEDNKCHEEIVTVNMPDMEDLEQSIKTIQEQPGSSGSIQPTTTKKKRPLSKKENKSNKQ